MPVLFVAKAVIIAIIVVAATIVIFVGAVAGVAVIVAVIIVAILCAAAILYEFRLLPVMVHSARVSETTIHPASHKNKPKNHIIQYYFCGCVLSRQPFSLSLFFVTLLLACVPFAILFLILLFLL